MKNEVSPSQIERRAPTKDALYALLDTLIPLEIKQRGIDATRRARLLVAFVFFNLGACLLIYPFLMPYYPATHTLPMITLFNALGYSALLALMWVMRAERWPARLLTLQMWFAVAILSYFTGGVSSVVLYWHGLTSIFGMFLVSLRWGWFLTALTGSEIAIYGYLATTGALPPLVPGQGSVGIPFLVMFNCAFVTVATLTGWLYESSRRHANGQLNATMAQLQDGNEALARARDAAQIANRTKSLFLANMSHEIRTPLNAIIGYSEMLIEEAEDLTPALLQADLHKIQSSGQHLLGLINDILDLSKIEAKRLALSMETIDVSTLLKEVKGHIRPQLQQQQNTYQEQIEGDLPTLFADPMRLRQCILNLLSNANKFTKGGTVTLAARFDLYTHGANVPTEGHIIEIKDTGIGMSEAEQERIFEAFVQADASTAREYGGTGLGLAITRRLCQMMGGAIYLDSLPGRGSTFTLFFPKAKTP